MSAVVSKDHLLKETEEKARLEAARQSLDDYKIDRFISEAQDIVEEIFYSITWTKVENGFIISNDPISSWHHRGIEELESDWKYLEISRAQLRNAAEKYIERPWMQSKNIDWLVLNTLTYAEYLGTFDFIRRKLLPFNQYIAQKAGSTKGFIGANAWKIVVSVVKWAIWLAVFIASFIAAPYGPLLMIGFIGWWVWRKLSARKKIEEILSTMQSTYATLSTISQSWLVLWDELNKGGAKGITWDGIVYHLIEIRKQESQTGK